jgi:GNAT superfamily N-acetyltransferase
MAYNDIAVRNTRATDFQGIIGLCRAVYACGPWTVEQLTSHLAVFPEGQLVAVEARTQEVVGMAASLIVRWDDYDMASSWRDFTSQGSFVNHDPHYGRTLYGAEIMVRPDLQGRGTGSRLYRARRALAERLKLVRIRAGARLRGYCQWARQLTADQYVFRVIYGALRDPTLSFQLRQGFKVIGVVSDYLRHDPESLGYAAVIEWLNPAMRRGWDLEIPEPQAVLASAPAMAASEAG